MVYLKKFTQGHIQVKIKPCLGLYAKGHRLLAQTLWLLYSEKKLPLTAFFTLTASLAGSRWKNSSGSPVAKLAQVNKYCISSSSTIVGRFFLRSTMSLARIRSAAVRFA